MWKHKFSLITLPACHPGGVWLIYTYFSSGLASTSYKWTGLTLWSLEIISGEVKTKTDSIFLIFQSVIVRDEFHAECFILCSFSIFVINPNITELLATYKSHQRAFTEIYLGIFAYKLFIFPVNLLSLSYSLMSK